MSTVLVDIEEFKKTAKLFDIAADNCKAMESRIKVVTENLLSSWEGDTKNAFKREYNELTKDMYNYDEMLRMIASELEQIATSFEEVDNEIKRSLMK